MICFLFPQRIALYWALCRDSAMLIEQKGKKLKTKSLKSFRGIKVKENSLDKRISTFIQSEVSQKEKHQYSILTHIYGI